MGKTRAVRIQQFHEAAASINLAFAIVAFLFLLGPNPMTSALFRMDVAISQHLSLLPVLKHPKDYFTLGYFAFLIPAVALAVFMWLLLRLFSRTRPAREFLRSVAGLAALIALPVFWLCNAYASQQRYGWDPLTAIQFYEVLLVLVLWIAYVSVDWPAPGLAAAVVLLLHYGFWFWQFGPYAFFVVNAGPIGPAAALCAGSAWFLYLRQVRRLRPSAREEVGAPDGTAG
jgi:hypothetical protein